MIRRWVQMSQLTINESATFDSNERPGQRNGEYEAASGLQDPNQFTKARHIVRHVLENLGRGADVKSRVAERQLLDILRYDTADEGARGHVGKILASGDGSTALPEKIKQGTPAGHLVYAEQSDISTHGGHHGLNHCKMDWSSPAPDTSDGCFVFRKPQE